MKRLALLPPPVLVAVYPVFAVYVLNSDQVALSEVWRALLAAAVFGLVVWAWCRGAFGRADKAAVLGSALAAVFFNHGQLANAVGPAAEPVLVIAEIAGLSALGVWIFRRTASVQPVVDLIVLSTAVLYASSVLMLVVGTVQRSGGGRSGEAVTGTGTGGRRPDIYYVILDAYGRADTLQDYVGLDNRPFVAALEQRGFTVLPSSRSNYGQTLLSVASSLNFELLDPGSVSAGGPSDFAVVSSMIKHNAVMATLEAEGYRVVTIPSGFQGTDPMPQADVVWAGRPGALNEFEWMAVRLTAGSRLLAFARGTDAYELHRTMVLRAFEGLRTSAPRPGDPPRFVFVHVLAPHPPFVFDDEGRLPPQDGPLNLLDGRLFYGRRSVYQEGYAAQVRFLNGRILEAVDGILAGADPDRRPIIILQGDHGPSSFFDPAGVAPDYMRERMSILNAWYVPPDLDVPLYDTITPVNAFRVVFNTLFDTKLPLLPDRSLFSSYDSPYGFREVDANGEAVSR